MNKLLEKAEHLKVCKEANLEAKQNEVIVELAKQYDHLFNLEVLTSEEQSKFEQQYAVDSIKGKFSKEDGNKIISLIKEGIFFKVKFTKDGFTDIYLIGDLCIDNRGEQPLYCFYSGYSFGGYLLSFKDYYVLASPTKYIQ